MVVETIVGWALASLKAIGAPGSLGFLVLCCCAGLALVYLWPRKRVLGHVWLVATFSVYLVLGTPAVANGIAAGLSPVEPAGDLSQMPRADVVVLVAGDNIVGRLRETLRAYHAWQPRMVIVSAGDNWCVRQLVNGGVPRSRILLDRDPQNTFEQIAAVPSYRQRFQGASFVLIASRLQMQRVQALVRELGLDVGLLSSPADAEPHVSGIRRWMPQYAALRISRDAIYERAAMAYYAHRHGFTHGGSEDR